ncbi:DNA polymerase III catalytic subunit, PolC type [Clostridium collagenovorans DSM 3089]|uniref:DNA polymerase III PolC-type n=1 Tax=Clostridium collagenovorans DSM 3089 TaxID=1121306 RepID=A0A1M5SVX2_9CLOT|nr:PolC-type DNA polymerase III [Clostridium collagenovorans]SHH42625.1 DNA polymerase III catalytic subunit, PolC type [Clostridium collagenovorans DSM 3089]
MIDLDSFFTENISKEEYNLIKDITFKRIQYLRKESILRVIIKSSTVIEEKVKEVIKKIIVDKLYYIDNVELVCLKDISEVSLEEIIEKYWNDIVSFVTKSIPVGKECLTNCKKELSDGNLNIYYGNEFVCRILKGKNIEGIVKHTIKDMFGVNPLVKLIYSKELDTGEYFREKESENIGIIKDVVSGKIVSTKDSKPKEAPKKNKEYGGGSKGSYKENRNYGPKDKNAILGRGVNEEPIEMKEIVPDIGIVSIKGDVFKVELKETRTGNIIMTFFITDYTSSIAVKIFIKGEKGEHLLDEIKNGVHLKIKGQVEYDMYSRDLVLKPTDIVKMEKIEKMDLSSEKRVELHLHTTMSSMDGLTPASKLIERAGKWGHKAIAITDHGVAQAFPEAQSAGKKHGVKIIYGVEGYLVDDGETIAIGGEDRSLEDEYVVFDIETTGFSSDNDKIIEIGAVKVKDGQIIDSFNVFVNPERKIPLNIIELTGINNDMVKDAETIENVLPKFMKFIGESVVVAHNATFDTSFIRKNCNKINLKFNNPIMDTIPLCKYIFPDLKRYKLSTIVKHLGITLEQHHRAVDDARATADILLHCFKELKEKNIENIGQLNAEFIKNFNVKNAATYHIIILAKNQVGIKNLYKLISEANLEYFKRRPRMPKSRINYYKEGLIIGSACEAGQVFKELLSGKSLDELESVVDFYDYVEIQPIGNNQFMIKNGTVNDEKDLQEINKKLYELGKRYNKPVIATGDVHFMDPEDAVFRAILMAGQGFDDADDQAPLYYRTTEEMLREFSYLGEDIAKEVVITNPNAIADMVEEIKPIPDETFTPKIEGAEEDIRNMTMEKAHSIYGEPLPEVVQKRLDKELNSIISNGYAVLYLIAHKLVAKSLSDGYLVGSRGSVGSSLVATMSDITEVNGLPPHYVCPKCKHSEFILDGSVGAGVDLPEKNCEKCGEPYIRDGFDIPFETFLGFEGDKEPDIDLNFSGDNQADIHKYTEELFGHGHTFKAGTIGTIADKTAYGYVKKYLDERNKVSTTAEIERLTIGCTGVKRTSGQHPGGIMVVPSDNEIFNFCPIQHPADDPNSDIVTTHFDYHSISGRLLKLDILGHDDPTVLRMLKDLTGIDPTTVPLGDEKVLSIFTTPEGLGLTEEELGCEVGCYGIPEFGTKFVRQMLIDTQPKTFSDLVRISGLSHGTDVWLNNAQYYIKEGYTTLKDCIATRDDIMVYLIYQGLPPKTAFTIMEKVRKGKGLSEEHEKVMRENNVPEWYIGSCKKIKYMFPKGHAAAYVMMAIRIAYFKVYYPEAYYTAYFTVRADEFDGDLIIKGNDAILAKMKELYDQGNNISVKDKGLLTTLELCHEMGLRGIDFLEVDLYKSAATKFTIENGKIRMPLSALEGVGDNAADSIELARKDGEFISKEDLRLRTKVSRTVIEALDHHGCLKGMSDTNQLCLF